MLFFSAPGRSMHLKYTKKTLPMHKVTAKTLNIQENMFFSYSKIVSGRVHPYNDALSIFLNT